MISQPDEALNVLQATSRTFYIPISRLPSGLLEAVASGYLCMRAIDEIEDHPGLDNHVKASLLKGISQDLQSMTNGTKINSLNGTLITRQDLLPEVTLRLEEWTQLSPSSIAPRIWDTTAAMADRMAFWAMKKWKIQNVSDLDGYTFSVAGAVGLLLSDLWAWYDGTQTDRVNAIGFGRGLQSINILRNRNEDLERGVDFYPDGWDDDRMQAYARRNLALADAYISELTASPALDFCRIPLALAYATIDTLVSQKRKLNRAEVLRIVEGTTSEKI